PQLHRVVWSESDGLPGMILDRYGDQFVLQLTTLGMDQRKEILINAIGEVLGGRTMIERSDAAVRRAEGLPLARGVLHGEARAAARDNSKRNQLPVRWVEQDVFVYLRAVEKAGAQFDLIVLDPPSFTKSKSRVRDAIRGYRELHLRAFKLLSRDGILATFSCSHHVTDAILSETISAALVDARRSARRLRRFEQAFDHPILPTMPETEYFKGVL